MKKIFLFFSTIAVFWGCSDEDYNIPKNDNGQAVIYYKSECTTTGISTLDNTFSVTAKFYTAKPGDVMDVSVLKMQPYGESSTRLQPVSGFENFQQVTIGSDGTATVTLNRENAFGLNAAGDYVTVTFAGDVDYAYQQVDLENALTVSKPSVDGEEISVARTNETAYFEVTATPKSKNYNGTLIVKRKNGVNDSWVDVEGSPFSGSQPFMVPIKGTDFANGKDTMYYTFTASQDGFTDVIEQTVIVIDPYFFYKRSANLALGEGRDMLKSANVTGTDASAMLVLTENFEFAGGAAWLAAGNKIEFVETTAAMYSANNSNDAIAAFEAGEKVTSTSPGAGVGCFIYKITTKAGGEYYGMIQSTNIIPGTSAAFEYRIGNLYTHIPEIK